MPVLTFTTSHDVIKSLALYICCRLEVSPSALPATTSNGATSQRVRTDDNAKRQNSRTQDVAALDARLDALSSDVTTLQKDVKLILQILTSKPAAVAAACSSTETSAAGVTSSAAAAAREPQNLRNTRLLQSSSAPASLSTSTCDSTLHFTKASTLMTTPAKSMIVTSPSSAKTSLPPTTTTSSYAAPATPPNDRRVISSQSIPLLQNIFRNNTVKSFWSKRNSVPLTTTRTTTRRHVASRRQTTNNVNDRHHHHHQQPQQQHNDFFSISREISQRMDGGGGSCGGGGASGYKPCPTYDDAIAATYNNSISGNARNPDLDAKSSKQRTASDSSGQNHSPTSESRHLLGAPDDVDNPAPAAPINGNMPARDGNQNLSKTCVIDIGDDDDNKQQLPLLHQTKRHSLPQYVVTSSTSSSLLEAAQRRLSIPSTGVHQPASTKNDVTMRPLLSSQAMAAVQQHTSQERRNSSLERLEDRETDSASVKDDSGIDILDEQQKGGGSMTSIVTTTHTTPFLSTDV